jgi:hypothetical protein
LLQDVSHGYQDGLAKVQGYMVYCPASADRRQYAEWGGECRVVSGARSLSGRVFPHHLFMLFVEVSFELISSKLLRIAKKVR